MFLFNIRVVGVAARELHLYLCSRLDKISFLVYKYICKVKENLALQGCRKGSYKH